MSGSATGLVTHAYHDSLWWELGRVGAELVEALPKASLKGCKVLRDCRLSRLYLLGPPATPYVAILFRPKRCIERELCKSQKTAEAGSKDQVCVSPLINDQSCPSSQPNGSHLCCHHHANQLSTLVWRGFCASEKCNCVVLICLRL